MKKIPGWLVCVLVIVIIYAGVKVKNIVQEAHDQAQKAQAGVRDTTVTVQTGVVSTTRIDNILTFNGDIEALHEVDVQPRVSGRLLSLELDAEHPVDEGVVVKKGQLIATLDDRELAAVLANAKAAVAAAEAQLLTAKATRDQQIAALANAQAGVESAKTELADKTREMQREKQLLDAKATTGQSYDFAVTAYDKAEAGMKQSLAGEEAAKAQLQSAEAGIKQAEAALIQSQAALQQAEVNFAETRIYAPMDGVISARKADPGAMLNTNTTIVSMVSIDTVKVILSIPMTYLAQIIPGETKVTITTQSLPGHVIDGVVSKIYPTVDSLTRAASIEVRVKNIKNQYGDYQLKPGMYATAQVLIESRENVVAVDISLPIRNLDRQILYKVEGTTVKAVNVKLGIRFNQMVEILEGVQAGDEIVVVGQHRLTDGATIRKVEAAE